MLVLVVVLLVVLVLALVVADNAGGGLVAFDCSGL